MNTQKATFDNIQAGNIIYELGNPTPITVEKINSRSITLFREGVKTVFFKKDFEKSIYYFDLDFINFLLKLGYGRYDSDFRIIHELSKLINDLVSGNQIAAINNRREWNIANMANEMTEEDFVKIKECVELFRRLTKNLK